MLAVGWAKPWISEASLLGSSRYAGLVVAAAWGCACIVCGWFVLGSVRHVVVLSHCRAFVPVHGGFVCTRVSSRWSFDVLLAVKIAAVVAWCKYWSGLRSCLVRRVMWLTRGGCRYPSSLGATTRMSVPKVRGGLDSASTLRWKKKVPPAMSLCHRCVRST
eukprot:5675979-Pyramimonas_sp.AAC.1